jgi:peptide/nickel transport system ATP-binding protein
MTEQLLQVEELATHFFTGNGVAKAVDGVSFSLAKGEILGLVGESGSGKSVTGFSILRLVDPPGRVVSGRVMFDGQDLASLSDESIRAIRGKRIAMIFQDPMMTLNPVLRIDTQMVEAMQAHAPVSRKAALDRCRQVLAMVGISAPHERLASYPHHFSGGMRQRVAIAIALLHEPDLIIADEPTTALDDTIQAQILAEVQKLAAQTGTALIWISHDLAVVSALADRIAVMYGGRIVEQGRTADVIERPLHPYTRGLIDSVPSRNKRGEPLRQIPGMAPSIFSLPKGCAFQPRCSRGDSACLSPPPGEEHRPGQWARCFHPHGAEMTAKAEALA